MNALVKTGFDFPSEALEVHPDVDVLAMRVVETRALNAIVRLMRLAPIGDQPLVGWSAGSHIEIEVTLGAGVHAWREYSLIDMDGLCGTTGHENEFVIAVRKDAKGRGGSMFVHEQLSPGDSIRVRPPKNDFVLDDESGPVVLLAGGIGITPLIGMACHCQTANRSMRFYYAGQRRVLMAFLPELEARFGASLHVHADDECGGALLDLDAVLDHCPENGRLYVCGPRPMLDAVLNAASRKAWDSQRVHFELFTAKAPSAEGGDRAFELVLARSGTSLTVQSNQSILDCLIEHGFDDLLYDCKRGECGVCTLDVLSGEIDHRDYVLTDAEKAGGKVMQICVSRAKGDRLVLDL